MKQKKKSLKRKKVETMQPMLQDEEKEKNSNKYKGLCKDCKNRKTCTYPKSEGGVWHCEEYQ